MKVKIKKITKKKVTLAMNEKEASILGGLLNHTSIADLDPVLNKMGDKLHEVCQFDEATFHKTLRVVE